MGNCQAIDAATLVIQHPSGKADKLYWPVCASEIMKANPGHYVALLISTTSFCPTDASKHHPTAVAAANSSTGNRPTATSTAPGANLRVTRIKLLRPTDTLALGHVYRLITAQEVMKVLSAKKYAKMKKLGGQQQSPESVERLMGSDMKLDHLQQAGKHERQRERNHKTSSTTSSNSGTPRPRTWQPSLHSISEATS